MLNSSILNHEEICPMFGARQLGEEQSTAYLAIELNNDDDANSLDSSANDVAADLENSFDSSSVEF